MPTTPLNRALLIMETGVVTTLEVPAPTSDAVAFLQQVCDGFFDVLTLDDGLAVWFPDDGTGHRANPVATVLVHALSGAVHLLMGPVIITSCADGQIVDMPSITRQRLRDVVEATRTEPRLLARITAAALINQAWMS